jgi:hypothetical protein
MLRLGTERRGSVPRSRSIRPRTHLALSLWESQDWGVAPPPPDSRVVPRKTDVGWPRRDATTSSLTSIVH